MHFLPGSVRVAFRATRRRPHARLSQSPFQMTSLYSRGSAWVASLSACRLVKNMEKVPRRTCGKSNPTHVCFFVVFLKLIFIFRPETFSQSDFQKDPELNKHIYKEDMHILHNYEKYLKIILGKVQRLKRIGAWGQGCKRPISCFVETVARTCRTRMRYPWRIIIYYINISVI